MSGGPRRGVCGEEGGPGGWLPCWGKRGAGLAPQEPAGPQVRKAGALASSAGVPVAAGLSCDLPAPRLPGVTWGLGSAAAGVGEEAVGGPGVRGRGVPR